jgi:Zn-dependent M28 family amino/carboxypeptidase
MYTIPEAFKEFISPNCNRAAFIQAYLKAGGIDSAIMNLEGKNHIYVKFPSQQYNPMFRIKTVIAHYDRIGIGANDNSAAVFCLMEWARGVALRQAQGPQQHNISLIFTDGEELGSGGITEQGAFPLAQTFRKLGITNDDIYVFDCMGRGDVPILGAAKLPPNVPTRFLTAYSELEDRAKQILKSVSNGKWFTLPISYSDNASFIANGIPAVVITMLPSQEVQQVLASQLPDTWKFLHTTNDNFDSLDPTAFEIFFKLLNELSKQKNLL